VAHVTCAETREIASVFPSMYKRRQAFRGRLKVQQISQTMLFFCRKCGGNAEMVSHSSWYAVGHFSIIYSRSSAV